MAKNDAFNTHLDPDAFEAFEKKLEEPACPTPELVDAFRRSRRTFGLADTETPPRHEAEGS